MADKIYMSSSQVDVFPSTKRGPAYASQSRLLSEKSFSRLVNQLVDRDSFIIKYDSASNSIEFNIHGYYFKLSNFSDSLSKVSTTTDLYACIEIDNTTQELLGQDITTSEGANNYEGVYLTTKKPSSSEKITSYYLLLGSVTREGESIIFTENADSYIMFNMGKMDLKVVDCGIVDE